MWPFQFARGWRSWNLYLPLVALMLYAGYEVALPPEIDIRVDLMILMPLLLFVCLNGMAKVGLLKVLMGRAGRSRRRFHALPQRRLQLALMLPILAGCAFWFWMMWR